MITKAMKTTQIVGPYHFTEDEILAKKTEIPKLYVRKMEIESQADESKKRFKSLVDQHETQIKVLVGEIRDGYEIREQECFVYKDYTRRIRQWVACETGNVIKEAPFVSGDDQMNGSETQITDTEANVLRFAKRGAEEN